MAANTSAFFLTLAFAMTLTLTLSGVEGQPDYSQSATFWKLSETDQIINIAQYLAGNDDLLRRMIAAAHSLEWLERITNGQRPQDAVSMTTLLDVLPEVLKNPFFKLAIIVTLDDSGTIPLDPETRDALMNVTSLVRSREQGAWSGIMESVFGSNLRSLFHFARYMMYATYPQQTLSSRLCFNETFDMIDRVLHSSYNSSIPTSSTDNSTNSQIPHPAVSLTTVPSVIDVHFRGQPQRTTSLQGRTTFSTITDEHGLLTFILKNTLILWADGVYRLS